MNGIHCQLYLQYSSGLGTGIYTTNSPEACFYIAQSASCNVIVVDDDKQLQKILQIRHRLPHLKAVIQYRGKLKQDYDNVYTVLQNILLDISCSNRVGCCGDNCNYFAAKSGMKILRELNKCVISYLNLSIFI